MDMKEICETPMEYTAYGHADHLPMPRLSVVG